MQTHRRIEWPVALFLIINPVVALVGTAWVLSVTDVHWGLWLFTIVFAAATNLSVTAGYHRLFAHRSYEANPLVQWLFLLIGASGFQGSALKWASDHRRHHSEVDTDGDPYSIKKGFWHAHMGWLFFKDYVDLEIQAPDLRKNKRVVFQDRYYVWVASFMGFVVPLLVGWAMGSIWAGLFIAGSLRIFLTQQSTFFVNSLCHTLGRQTYSREVSARDSVIVALLTHGEGYHNFHHTFQIDYRNGIKWYHWDPTKWTIVGLKWAGLASKLRTVPAAEILRARLSVEALELRDRGFSQERIEQMREKILEAMVRWRKMKEEYATLRRQMRDASEARLRALKLEIELAKLEFRTALEQWHLTLRMGVALA